MPAVKYRSMMSPSDAIIWHIERDPQLRSTIMCVWTLDSVPTQERMRDSVMRMVVSIPRMRQSVEEARPRPRWVDVDELRIDDHYSTHELPPGSTTDDALQFAQDWVRVPFDRSRPLWQLGLITGLADGKAAVVIKVHHAIADGIGMVLMLAAFTDLEPHPVNRFEIDHPPQEHERPAWTRRERVAHRTTAAVRAMRRNPWAAIGGVLETLASALRVVWPNRTPHSRLMTRRSGELCLDTRSIPLRTVKEAGRAAGVSVNDVFVGLVADAVARYHDRHGVSCDRLRIHMPVNIRNDRTATLAGNQFVPARVSLRVPARGASTGLVDVRSQLERLRAEPALPHINAVSAAIQKLGVTASRCIIGGMMKGVDVLASNVPGPHFPIFLAGAEVSDFVAFGPPAGAAINVTLFSYRAEVYLGITTDAASVDDRMALLECFDTAIAAITARAESAVATAA